MNKKGIGALGLSFVMLGAVAVPVTLGVVHAATAGGKAEFSVSELETFYENILEANFAAEKAEDSGSGSGDAGVVRGADSIGAVSSHADYASLKGQGRNYWSENDINPDFGNVTISYKYASAKATSVGPQGFGFRFTVGDKHVALLRFQRSLSIVQYDTTGESVKVKISADSYFAAVNGKTNVLASGVNSGNYTTITTTTNSGKSNGTPIFGTSAATTAEVAGGLPAITAGVGPWTGGSSGNFCIPTDTISVVHTLRKITDEEGNVSFKFYEDGNLYCTFEFEEEVTAYAPHLAAPGADYLTASDFEVTLNDAYTEYDATKDAVSATKEAFLEVGDSVTYTYVRRAQSNPGPFISFGYNDTIGNGVAIFRFAKRLHLAPMTNNAKSGTRSVYIKSNPENQGYTTSKANGDYDNLPGTVVTMAGDTDANQDIAQNHTSNGLDSGGKYASDKLTYRIVRIADEEHEDKTYAMYEFYEKDEGMNGTFGEWHLADIGIPLDDITNGKGGVTFFASQNLSTPAQPDFCLTMETSALDELKNSPEANPDRDGDEKVEIDWAELSEKSSVRFTAESEGLRFTATASRDLINGLKATYEEVEFGVKLVRSDGKVAYIEAVNYSVDTKTGLLIFNGVVVNIKDYSATYTPYVYVKYDGQELLTEAGEAKSIKQVAQEMLEDRGSLKDSQIAILEKYAQG